TISEIIRVEHSSRNIRDQIKKICSYFDSENAEYDSAMKTLDYVLMLKNETRTPKDIFIIIHNIDGKNFFNEDAQELIGKLANNRHIHFICTTDKLNAQLCKYLHGVNLPYIVYDPNL